MTDIKERLRFDAARCEATFSKGVAKNIEEGIVEIEQLRSAVWSAIPWLRDLEHLGSLVDQNARAKTAEMLAAAVRSEQSR